MSFEFNADEIFEIAEKIERNGESFYRSAADSAPGRSKKDLLTNLANMEVGHIHVFQNLRKELSGKEQQNLTFDPDEETALYLKAFADSHIFFQKKIDVSSLENILRAAIQAEKDSIVFYVGLKDAVSESRGQDKIETIIKEEMGHLRLLNREIANLAP